MRLQSKPRFFQVMALTQTLVISVVPFHCLWKEQWARIPHLQPFGYQLQTLEVEFVADGLSVRRFRFAIVGMRNGFVLEWKCKISVHINKLLKWATTKIRNHTYHHMISEQSLLFIDWSSHSLLTVVLSVMSTQHASAHFLPPIYGRLDAEWLVVLFHLCQDSSFQTMSIKWWMECIILPEFPRPLSWDLRVTQKS